MLKNDAKLKAAFKKNLPGACVLIIAFLLILAGFLISTKKETVTVRYNEFITLVQSGLVREATLNDAPTIAFSRLNSDVLYITDNPRNPELKEYLLKQNIIVSEGSTTPSLSMAQSIIAVSLLAGALFFIYKSSAKTGIRSEMAMEMTNENDSNCPSLAFSDVAGNPEAKESVEDIVDFIKNPDKYSAYGARMPKGIIFYGPPGTGKTLLAKAIAGEAGVPFYAVSGSDFVQMYVGVGAGRIRELFKTARTHGKAVIFIDEIDALGKKRNGGQAGGNDERDQTLNALLTEMSGFKSTEGIVVIAATNRLDTLDEALLRPGRFDRQIEIGLPDIKAREDILRFHSRNKPLGEDVDIPLLARQTVYFSGAMLENLLNESAISAARRSSNCIDASDIDKAYYTIIAGSEKKDRSSLREKDKKITAFHEAGHAVVTKLAAPENTVAKISIIPSTKGAGGFCMNIGPDRMFYTKKELEAQVMIALGGRAAEELIFGPDNITTGAGNDIEKATGIIRDYILRYGMGENIAFLDDKAGNIAEECEKLAAKLYTDTKELLALHIGIVQSVAESLLLNETMDEPALDHLMLASKSA